MRHELYVFVAAILYPLWLIAAGCDYLCHRRTDIEHTAGWRESALHVLEYVCIAPIVVLAALYTMTGAVLFVSTVAVVLHTVLAYVDVRYTRRHRFIPRFEQRLHYLLTALPILAVMVLALLDANGEATGVARRDPNGLTTLQLWLIFGGTAVIGGVPVLEELIRTLRAMRPTRATTSSRAREEPPPVR
jgi:hypothetical protein